MAWEQLSINRPHLVYIILGGFTSLFMLCSSVIKEKLYIGEATVATLCGIIFGPHAANLINPGTWGNTDQITLEFARIVLVVQCFAVGVELPKAYMERHWRSVTLLLIPVMTFGWLVTSLFIWALIPPLNWLDSLCVAACVTATDPVLASSVVGKGKFAKRVPKHLRDLLSAESGCNDGMAFPFIYLAIYIIRYRHHPNEVALHWFCISILYECVFGAFYGVCIGYIARRAIRLAHEKDLIDRESFLVFYFVLALFCAGSGSILGVDDLLVGFACGVGFSNDGWFTEKTEESHVSNVIDLLINLAFFVYFGTIIPWAQYNSDILGLSAWRLVVLGLLVLLFRRIPIMLMLKPMIPDIKTWREALFAGHFGPIGVGGLFVAILARAELETDSTTPLEAIPEPGFAHLNIIELIWPITTFLVICSIIVHGSSIAVFTLGKRINTLTLTMSYTQANEEGPSWMERLPRIQSRSKSSMSLGRPDDTESSLDEKTEFPNGVLPGNFLRRQREEDMPSRPMNRRKSRRQSKYKGEGGPISQSAIAPQKSPEGGESREGSRPAIRPRADSEAEADKPMREPMAAGRKEHDEPDTPGEAEAEVFEEGNETVYEDEEGNVLAVEDSKPGDTEEQRQQHEREEGHRLMQEHQVHHGVAFDQEDPHEDEGQKFVRETEDFGHEVVEGIEHPQKEWRKMMKKGNWSSLRKKEDHSDKPKQKPKKEIGEMKRGPARAYQFGNTIIVEDEDGEVLKKYDIPAPPKKSKGESSTANPQGPPKRLQRMGTAIGIGGRKTQQLQEEAASADPDTPKKKRKDVNDEEDDSRLRFTIDAGGRRMSKAEFIRQISQLDPKARAKFVEQSDVPETVKDEARQGARETGRRPSAQRLESHLEHMPSYVGKAPENVAESDSDSEMESGSSGAAAVKRISSNESARTGPDGLTLIDSNDRTIPFHDVTSELRNRETAAERRRREARERAQAQYRHSPPPREQQEEEEEEDSEDDGTERIPPPVRQSAHNKARFLRKESETEGETAAERRRREGALGVSKEESDSDEDERSPRRLPTQPQHQSSGGSGNGSGSGSGSRTPGIRFADVPGRENMESPQQQQKQQEKGSMGKLRWGSNRRG